jgi:hypothetical protein
MNRHSIDWWPAMMNPMLGIQLAAQHADLRPCGRRLAGSRSDECGDGHECGIDQLQHWQRPFLLDWFTQAPRLRY